MSPYANDDAEPWPGVLDDIVWRHGDIAFPGGDQDGADWLFAMLTDRTPEVFQEWAQDYYETPVDLDAVRLVHAGKPMTTDVVTALNPATTLAALADRIVATGYPVR